MTLMLEQLGVQMSKREEPDSPCRGSEAGPVTIPQAT